MDSNKITFKKASKADKEIIQGWLKKSHVKSYWKNPEEIMNRFEASLKSGKASDAFWICSYEKKPFGLLLTVDPAEPDPVQKHTPDHFVPWLEEEGMTLLIDFIICEPTLLEKGLAVPTLQRFAETRDNNITALLADPEVKNEKGMEVYEHAGFAKVGTFIKGEGFFKGTPHYLLKRKLSH